MSDQPQIPWPNFAGSRFKGFRPMTDDERTRLGATLEKLRRRRRLTAIIATSVGLLFALVMALLGKIEFAFIFFGSFPFFDYFNTIDISELELDLKRGIVAVYGSGGCITPLTHVNPYRPETRIGEDHPFQRQSRNQSPSLLELRNAESYLTRPLSESEIEWLVERAAGDDKMWKRCAAVAGELLAAGGLLPVFFPWTLLATQIATLAFVLIGFFVVVMAIVMYVDLKHVRRTLKGGMVHILVRSNERIEFLKALSEALIVDGFPTDKYPIWEPEPHHMLVLPQGGGGQLEPAEAQEVRA